MPSFSNEWAERMGSSSSKFRRLLLNGDEYAALHMLHNTLELREHLDPNSSYGDSLQHNNPLHLAAQYGMIGLMRFFLNDLNGNPNKQNAAGKTSLHLTCEGNVATIPVPLDKRLTCVELVLRWRGSGGFEKTDVEIEDNDGNTALHTAAAAGHSECVQLLLKYGSPLFLENKAGYTACELAEKNGHIGIAEFLESKMVFSESITDSSSDVCYLFGNDKSVSGLRSQDLQEAKDLLLVETSDMLHVPLFTAEVLLRNHEWSRQNLLDSWMANPVECCEEAGISPPTSAIQFSISNNCLKLSCERVQEEYQNESLNSPAKSLHIAAEMMCDICAVNIPLDEAPVLVPCYHQFCRTCWKEYLTVKIKEGEAHNILCPAYACHYLVPVDVIERVVSPDLVRRYLKFDIEAFVETNPNIKWCPSPGCGRAVKLPELEPVPHEIVNFSSRTLLDISHSVDCGNGHYFCWECLGEAHAPCSCSKWNEWHEKINEIKPQEMKNTCDETENAANWLWMVTNSKACPNCKSPIQKNEGCNYMKCSKCKFVFCWICLENWKKHGSSTGGFFRCNRLDAVQKAETKSEALITQAEAHNKRMQELKTFFHYYSKFDNHEMSYKHELPFLESIQNKMIALSTKWKNGAIFKVEGSVQFLEDAISELLRSRRILCGSYVYGYYLEDNGYNKTIFEIMQGDLEKDTIHLSDVIARKYIQVPSANIKLATNNVKRKRIDFLTVVLRGLIPPETPPNIRKSHRRRCPGVMGIDPVEDEQLSQAILASLHDYDPNNPWVKDHQGRHTNLSTLYNWSYLETSDEEDSSAMAVAASVLGVCVRENCTKPRARNSRTGATHDYCSVNCKHADMLKLKENELSTEKEVDPQMELLIAMEMSKLDMKQYINSFNEPNDLSARNEMPAETECKVIEKDDVVPENSSLVDICQQNFIKTAFIPQQERDDSNNNDNNNNDASPSQNPIVLSSNPEEEEEKFSNNSFVDDTSSIDFYLKISGETNDINSKNIDSSEDSYCKTEKELFVDIEKTNPFKRKDTIKSSRHSL